MLRTTDLGRDLCLIGASLGLVGLIGWLTGIEALVTIVPGQPPMMPNAAVALLLLGAAGAMRGSASPTLAMRSVSALIAVIVLAVGLATLTEYAVDLPFSIDQLLFRIEVGPSPGRPSPPTALALMLLAAAILLWDWRPAERTPPAEWLILFAGLIAFTATLGQAFGVGPLYRLIRTPIVGVAVHTALSLLLISVGLLLERPGSHAARIANSPSPGDIMLRRLALAFILMAISIGFAGALLSGILGSENLAVIAASLTVIGIVVGLSLLAITASQLNRAHEALEQSRQAARDLIEQASEGIYISDLEGRFTDVNSVGCRMAGYSREEILRKTIADLIPPDDLAHFRNHRARLLEGNTEVGEWALRRKNGSYLPVEVSAKILPDGRWLAFSRDISERKRAQEALQQAQARTRELIKLAADGIFIADLEGRYVDVNEAGCRMLGYDRAELVGKTIFDLILPEDEARLLEDRKRFLQGGSGIGEWMLRKKDGTYLPVEVSAKILPDGRWQGIVRDISERKRAEEALRLSEAKFSGIVSISADAIISIDEDQKITLFNEGAEKIFGRPRADVLGAPLEILIPERFRANHARHVERFASGSDAARRMSARDTEIFGVRSSGEEFPADAAISKLIVGGKRILTVALRDITELKEAEAEAKRATQARDDILGIVAHDLRNPLAAIASLAAVLQMGKAEGEIADEIATAVNRMNRLIGDLLDVTRMEAGHLSLKQERLPAAEVITDALEGQTALASAASLELRLTTAQELPDIWADRDRLLQVFENLIGNAIKFTKSGDRITLGAIAREGEVIFSVSDTGCGIAETHLPHVFDRFWQAPGTERRGMGFGLAIVKGIVEAHGGRVWVQSAPGQGSTFFFTIPTAATQTAICRSVNNERGNRSSWSDTRPSWPVC
jgi:PAS domain S-box-containing protein